MASSKKSASSDLLDHLRLALDEFLTPDSRIAAGLSGGVDSIVLLDLLVRLRRERPFRLCAVHVHHGLSVHADAWAASCARWCAARDIAFVLKRVKLKGRARLGVEAAARAARYAAFAEVPADCVVLAHHRDDQVETMLLQLLRGAGVRGAAAMAARGVDAAGRPLLRPLLEVPRSALVAHARRRKLAWVEDDSNLDTVFARNYLRHRVLPLIETRFPAYRDTLARAAGHFREAATLLDALARIDLDAARRHDRLQLAALARLEPPRARNLLRLYLQTQGVPLVSAERLEEWLHQLVHARGDRVLELGVAGLVLRRYRGELWVEAALPPPAADWTCAWQGEMRWRLPALGGSLIFVPATGAGVDAAKLSSMPVCVRLRQGGEKLRPHPARPRRALKSLLQEAGVPPWQRARLPLLYCGDALVAVPGIGIDAAWQAPPGAPGLQIEWRPADGGGVVADR